MNLSLSSACVASLLAVVISNQAAAKPTLSLDQVAERVRSANPDLAAARIQIEEAAGRGLLAGRLPNPELEVEFEHDDRFREGSSTAAFVQRFPLTNRLRLERSVAASGTAAAAAAVRDLERRLIAQAESSFIRLAALQQQQRVRSEQQSLSETLAQFVTSLVEKGEGSPLDASRARLEAARFGAELRQLEASEVAESGILLTLLGIPPGAALSINDTLPDPDQPSYAPTQRPDLELAEIEADTAIRVILLEKALRYDDIEAGIFAGAERREDAPEGFENEGIVGMRIRLPLPWRSRNEARIAEAEARYARREAELRALSLTIQREREATRAAMDSWAVLALEIERNQLPLAEEHAAAADRAYRSGLSDLQTVLRAQEERIRLAEARINALRDYHLARTEYKASLGIP